MAYRSFRHSLLVPAPALGTWSPSSSRHSYAVSVAALGSVAALIAGLSYALAYFAVGNVPVALISTTIMLLPFAAMLTRPSNPRPRVRRSALPVAFDVRAHR